MTQKVILVVDDEPHIVEMMTTFLTIKGYDVRGAYTGEGGMALINAERPDAVLLDLMLPDIEGFEVCQRLRAADETAELPVLSISARTDSASRVRAQNAGANAYFTKPVAMPLLINKLEEVLAAVEAKKAAPPAPPATSATSATLTPPAATTTPTSTPPAAPDTPDTPPENPPV